MPERRHGFGPYTIASKGAGHPIMFGSPLPAQHFGDFPDGGGYPKGFLEWAFKMLGCDDPSSVLHVCSGSVRTGVRVDIRCEMSPSVVADALALPFADETFDFVLADPPYSQDYASNLYGTGSRYPRPGRMVAEIGRVLRSGGRAGFLHLQVPFAKSPVRIKGVFGVTQGCGYAIRAWTLLEKVHENLSLMEEGSVA